MNETSVEIHFGAGRAVVRAGNYGNGPARTCAARACRRNGRCGSAPGIGHAGYGLLAAAIATALAALGAGFAVAKVGAAAIGALAEKPELFGRLLIFVGLAEGIAIYGLIVSILILNRLG